MVYDPHRDRIKNRAKKKAKERNLTPESFSSLQEYEEYVGKIINTPHPCSRQCCGNPRHHYKGKDRLTMQERKLLDEPEDDE